MNIFSNPFSNLTLIFTFVSKVFPLITKELTHWSNYASSHASSALRTQALASIRDKKFHCQGGSIYSLYPTVDITKFIPLIVSLQTISDYLDNLCDRADIMDEQAFKQLHLAMTDALTPDAPPQDYYAYYPFKEDGGYLKQLVITCQQQIKALPSYELVKSEVQKLACFYSELQTYKHLDPSMREVKMLNWIAHHIIDYPQITPWEFAAATGSTLGIFMLCAAASDRNLHPHTVKVIDSAYFPWISGLHILLDYFIDMGEDEANGDLNFVSYYQNSSQMLSRLTLFTEQAFLQASTLQNPSFHKTVVQGLLAMYLSDPKVTTLKNQSIRKSLLKTAGGYTRFLYYLCKLLRFKKKL
ncbi:tetraprenyl-beta-curcumene synthase family protein [Pelosinus sp. IPA-1]|uniref:tetraprenyl-beta-curcumene synthase family protein n=1 Tax=Pelosinus sp. IPA-1 TaxID=3029569 RepID=UPI0025552B8D|nr:tetraprenyl-beta-curcumene synthase family protein [Pelosinus sp. IPA-1]